MGIISLEQSGELYWLGRYVERVYATIRIFARSYDRMIDASDDMYVQFCRDLDIPNIYENKEDFLRRYPYDPSNPDSIVSNLTRAYDNAIVLRESIGSESLSYIQLSIYDLKKAEASGAPLLEMQKIIDHILAFYGIIDDHIDGENIRNIIKAGKRIERVDLYARLGLPKAKIIREVQRMIPRVQKCGLKYDESGLDRLNELLTHDSLDYYKIVEVVESVL